MTDIGPEAMRKALNRLHDLDAVQIQPAEAEGNPDPAELTEALNNWRRAAGISDAAVSGYARELKPPNDISILLGMVIGLTARQIQDEIDAKA